ncbi:two-component sensor histidine kinase [Sphaerisporangium melleum]|uniref:Sensor histidine kinase MtrB n=1 Tax=Sphaerisporangium melleum TaxID=321316 RepID=A0A917QRZ8_9ACTN|nr:MtrAB system histidine kinase MtrB [Sphaerisporangium melleum]GGK64755.1 two-component sensor histidine kinase [Sphaerisporangium melleum]GII70038.1 two-component sensor histidine kinase [Sphaerisporangium melleum]
MALTSSGSTGAARSPAGRPKPKKKTRRTPRQIVRGVRRRARRAAGRVRRVWRRSLQLRVVTSTLVISMVVVVVLGVFLLQMIKTAVLDGRRQTAMAEAQANVTTVAGYLAQTAVSTAQQSATAHGDDSDPAMKKPVDQAAYALARRGDGRYSVVILSGLVGEDRGTGNIALKSVNPRLRDAVRKAENVPQAQYTSMYYQGDPQPTPALAIGAMVPDAYGEYEVYHFFPLTDDVDTLSQVQQWLIAVSAVLVLLLAAVASLVTRQVVTPVRLTRQAAERLAAGRLEERLKVRGEDDLARLAASFNEMASTLAVKIHQLEELSQVQRQFVSDVSHELRTPLTTVRMAADLLYESREDFDPAAARSAELMQAQLERFESMLADLLEISRYDAGAATLDIDSVDMRDVVLRAVGDSQPLAERKATRLDLRLPNEPCMAEADSRRVERILRNLLFNAIEHGEGRDIIVTLGADRDAVAVAVRDHGVGLKAGEENMVFDRFWRADPSRARTIGGTGLGLAISREDAILHGGWLQAWGSPGEGSQFRLSLPRHAGAELRGSPLPLVPPEIEMRRTWRGHTTPVLSPAVEGAFDGD